MEITARMTNRKVFRKAVVGIVVLLLSLDYVLGIGVSFKKSLGSSQLIDGIRFPTRAEKMRCLGQCQQKASCTCVRMSNTEDEDCGIFTAQDDMNALNSSGYVYYAIDRYEETASKPSIAVKKPASQSSTYILNGVSYSADRAIDGIRNTDGFSSPYISHTVDDPKQADSFPWWQVDLKKEYVIFGIGILNRQEWADRLHDFEVRVGNTAIAPNYNSEHFDKNPLCHKHVGGGIGDGEFRKFFCLPCPVQGRYVTIQIVELCTNCTEKSINVLQLAEVDVFGVLP